MSAAETTTDPVQEALAALVGATETLGRTAGEYLEAAQVAALRGEQTPVAIHGQAIDAWSNWFSAVLAFEKAAANACPKAGPPTWEWARLDELAEGDLIHVGDTLPEGARWLTVVRTMAGSAAKPTAVGTHVIVWVAEQVPPLLDDLASATVRRQVVAEQVPDGSDAGADPEPWSAADETPIDLVPTQALGFADGIGGAA